MFLLVVSILRALFGLKTLNSISDIIPFELKSPGYFNFEIPPENSKDLPLGSLYPNLFKIFI